MLPILAVILILWIVFCILAGNIAKNNGRSFWGIFFVSLLLSPVIGAILALLMGESTGHAIERIREEERLRAEIRKESEK